MASAAQNFNREILKPDYLQIESTCVRCGAIIRASVTAGLERMESEHLSACARAASATHA